MENKNVKLKCAVRCLGDDALYKDVNDSDITFSYKIKSEDDISKTYEVNIKNSSSNDFNGIIHIKVEKEVSDPKVYMPGYMYNTNTAEMELDNRKAFPRIKKNSECKYESPFWMTRADRLAVPVSLIYDNGAVFGVSASPYWMGNDSNRKLYEPYDELEGVLYKHNGFSCELNEAGSASCGFTLGYENAPFLFVETMTVRERAELSKENTFEIKSNEEINFELIVYDYSGDSEQAVNQAIKHSYTKYHQSPRKIEGMNERKAVELLSGAIRDYAWLPDEDMYTGFVYDKPDGNICNKIGSLSWTNGLAVATPMLMAANKLNDEIARNQALCFINNVIENSYNERSGLLYDAVTDKKWSVHGWWYDGMRHGGHSGYINGQAVYYILKAYISELDVCGEVHDNWVEFVAPVIKQMNTQLDENYEYPFALSEDKGEGIEYDSMGGVWCLAATALYAYITKTDEYDEIMHKSEQHYYEKFVSKMECYGGPLDTDKAVDDEGILAFIRADRIMHEIFGDKVFLEHLRDAIYYECSFKLAYNTPVQVRPLCEMKWSSCGGSITSTANPHIHPMSSTIIGEMQYILKYMRDEYIEERLSDTIGWSMQTFNTSEKEYGYGRIGWMSERFCFCQGLLVEKYPDGEVAGTWFALMSWAIGSIIEGLVECI